MFNIKKNKLVAITSGEIFPITDSIDDMFNKKMLGDGYLIKPTISEIYSPVDGVVAASFPTKHALGIKGNDGHDYLIHIGIDTVNLKGFGFDQLVCKDEKIAKGQLLFRVDFNYIKSQNCCDDVMLVLTDGQCVKLTKNGKIKALDLI